MLHKAFLCYLSTGRHVGYTSKSLQRDICHAWFSVLPDSNMPQKKPKRKTQNSRAIYKDLADAWDSQESPAVVQVVVLSMTVWQRVLKMKIIDCYAINGHRQVAPKGPFSNTII